jgi:hypothetical protein
MAQDAVTVVPAGEGDLAVAAAFATGADSTKILPPARADSTDGEGDDDDDDDDDRWARAASRDPGRDPRRGR